MITRFLLSCFLFLAALNLAAQQKADAVIWSKEGLSWDLFQEVESIGGGNALARTFTKLHIVLEDSLSVQQGQQGVKVKIYALMIPSLSYVRLSANRKGVLEHEQIHFDNTELAARRLRKLLSEEKFTGKDYRKKINKLFHKTASQMSKMQADYDEQHRSKDKGHNWWRHYLDEQFLALSPFQSTELFVPVCDCK
ncbi:MAG: hypothetical protein JWP88_49 [Flaviaesturariibacter sp.]|nr:hypothetical protein [Flaviaesturariibacter sp.]